MSKAGDVALQALCDGFDSHNLHLFNGECLGVNG